MLSGNTPSVKPSILIQNAVHGGETAGKDATLMLVRDIVLGRYPESIKGCNLLVLPVVNVDGHERRSRWRRGNQNGPAEVGSRVTSQRINLNRDYMKADAPEMRAWLRFYQGCLPHLLIDNHTSNGIDFQYDITFHIQTRQMLWPSVAAWNRSLREALTERMHSDGHITGPYFEIEEPPRPGELLRMEFRTPGYSWGYASVQNRPAIVSESHSLKSYRTQVWAHYDLMRHIIDLVCHDRRTLLRAIQSADRDVAALAISSRPTRVFLDGEFSGVTRTYAFRGLKVKRVRSAVMGASVAEYTNEPLTIPVKVLERVRTTVAPTVPGGYVIPVEWNAALDLLRLHGVYTERLKRPIDGEFETYCFEDEQWDPQPVDGRHRLCFRCHKVRIKASASAGCLFVPLNQRSARVAMNLLEPSGPESLVRWGFFNTIFDQTEYLSNHAIRPIAERLLRSKVSIRRDFEHRLKVDPQFRNDSAARLDFFYQRSRYAEREKNLYPVWRVSPMTGFSSK
jgi:hypothetical protein